MKTLNRGRIMKTILVLAMAMTFCTELALAAGDVIGYVRSANGETYLVRNNARLGANIGDQVQRADVIETGPTGSIGITFVDNTVFSTGPNSSITLEQYAFDSAGFKGNLLARMNKGTLSVVSGDIARTGPGAMKIKTPTAILGVRGTTFLIKVDE